MRCAIFFCWLAWVFAPGAWAQAEPCPAVALLPSSLQLSEVSAPASALSTTQMDKAGIQVSPYQRWRQSMPLTPKTLNFAEFTEL